MFDPVQVRSEDTSFRVERIKVGEIHEITPMEKLLRRVSREFSRKNLIGDIVISDEEFNLLIEHMRNVYLVMYKNKYFVHMDAAFCTALVQIGMRYYDRGNYWTHFEKLLGFDFYKPNHRKWINEAFVNTLRRYNRVLLSESELVSSILMHGFVANNYTNDFFNFLFAYYRIDLDRDISRLDKEALEILIENIKRKDNTARTYQLIEQTADATRVNIRGSKTRIRRYLQLIDKAFWREQLPVKSCNRLTQAFLSWQEHSSELDIERRKVNGDRKHGCKHYTSPYLQFNYKTHGFFLVVPAQVVKFEDASPDLYWSIIINNQEYSYEINPYAAVTGYKTDELTLPVNAGDTLKSVQVDLMNSTGRLRQFKISEAPIRFFDNEGYMVSENAIEEGDAISLSGYDFIPSSDAIEQTDKLDSYRLTYYSFVNGDIVSFPDGKPISIGNRIQEGLLPRDKIEGVVAGEELVPVYRAVPSVLIKAQENRCAGMAIAVNGKYYKAGLNGEKIQSFDLMDRSGELGYVIHLSDWGCQEDGLYTVTIDVPNDHSTRQWEFILINGMEYDFEDAPYVFIPIGTLHTPSHLQFEKTGDIEKCDHDDKGYHWSFRITPTNDYVKLMYLGTELSFTIPLFSYCFKGEDWTNEYHNGVWHSEFQPVLYVKCPASKITFEMDGTGNDEDETHTVSFIKNQGKNLFLCDLNPFISCFDRDIAKRRIYLSFPGLDKKVLFLEVFTRSIVVSGMLTADYDERAIVGSFDIVGKGSYYVDLYFKEIKLAEKIPIVDGRVSIPSNLRSGSYVAKIFETEEDEFGFDDLVYYEIEEKSLELVNARDLSGKCIRIVSLMKTDSDKSPLQLKRDYAIYNLVSMDNMLGHCYTGTMVVKNNGGEDRGVFNVYLEIPDLNKINRGYITFDDDGDPTEFLYDDDMKFIVRRPQEGLSSAASYRRYNKSIFPEDYVYEYEFIPAEHVNGGIPTCNDTKDYNRPAIAYSVDLKFKNDDDIAKMPKGTQSLSHWNCKIEAAGFSIRTNNSLLRAGYKDLMPLCRMRYSELLKIRNLGKSGVFEIIRVLNKYNLPLPIEDVNLFGGQVK